MELKIWMDGEGRRHTSLGGIEISNIITRLTLEIHPLQPAQVELVVIPDIIEVEAEAKISIKVGDKKYSLKE